MVQRLIETISLLMLVAVVILRPLVAESYDSAGSSINEALGGVGDPSPLRTLVFDLVILCGTCGWLVARAVGQGRRYRWTGLEIGAVLVAVAAVISCVFAGNKRLAINASIDWLCLPVLTIGLVQLMHGPWQRRLLLSAVLASACVQAAQCLEQHFVGFDETWAHYESIKEDFWARQGVDLDSAKVGAFERRIKAQEASGFLMHSNVTGSYLVLCGMAALAVAIDRWRRAGCSTARLAAVGATAGTVLIVTAAIVAKSVGALTAGGVGVILWAVLHRLRPWIDAHRTKALVIAWLGVATGAFAVVGHGLYHDSLPGWSLTFRWQYWSASSQLVADHALTGVGRENYGRHYLRYKPIENPEEVSNPHNLFVQAAADWGVLGLVGVVAMMVGVSILLARQTRSQSNEIELARGPPSGRGIFGWAAAMLLVVTLVRLPLLGTNDPNYLYYSAVTVGLVWALGFACFAPTTPERASPTEADSRLVRTGVAMGLFAFLLHDMINFAAFVPGTAMTFFALLALCQSERRGGQPYARTRAGIGPWLAVAASVAAIVLVVVLGVLPVGRSARTLALAEESGRQLLPVPLTAQVADHYFRQAADLDPLDPTPYVRRTEWSIRASDFPELQDEAFRLAGKSLDDAIQRDPHSLRLRRMKVQLYRRAAMLTGRVEDQLDAIEAAQAALELYPLDPSGIAALADCQLDAGETAGSDELLREAIDNYQRAVKLDDFRPPWAKLAGFHRKERAEIQSKIERAQRLSTGPTR